MRRLLALLLLAFLIAFPALLAAVAAEADGGHHGKVGPLTIVHAWARATPPTAKTGAVYLTIRNDGPAPDALVTAETPVAKKAEMHTHVQDGGVMQMRPIDALDIPVGGVRRMAPGGDHVMLMSLEKPLVEGERFPLRLRFSGAGETEIEVSVHAPGYRPPEGGGHDMPGHGHGHGKTGQ